MTAGPFDAAANTLHRQEVERLSAFVPPTLTALRSLTLGGLQNVVALMLERLGYEIVNDPTARDVTAIKDGRKFIVACATPADTEPTRTPAVARLHQAGFAFIRPNEPGSTAGQSRPTPCPFSGESRS